MDEILNLIESVSEGFPSYFCNNDLNGCPYFDLSKVQLLNMAGQPPIW